VSYIIKQVGPVVAGAGNEFVDRSNVDAKEKSFYPFAGHLKTG